MSGSTALPLNLVYIILLLVPGLVGLDLYLISSKKVGGFNRVQLLVYSIAASLFSIAVLYFLTPFYMDHFISSYSGYTSGVSFALLNSC